MEVRGGLGELGNVVRCRGNHQGPGQQQSHRPGWGLRAQSGKDYKKRDEMQTVQERLAAVNQVQRQLAKKRQPENGTGGAMRGDAENDQSPRTTSAAHNPAASILHLVPDPGPNCWVIMIGQSGWLERYRSTTLVSVIIIVLKKNDPTTESGPPDSGAFM